MRNPDVASMTPEAYHQHAQRLLTELEDQLRCFPPVLAVLTEPVKLTGEARWRIAVQTAQRQRHPHAPRVTSLWSEIESTWWALARTADHICRAEARRHHARVGALFPRDDLEQEGQLGAYRAAQTWDPSGGASWETYAGGGIRFEIQAAIRKGGGLIHLPCKQRELANNLRRTVAQLEQRGEEPSPGRLAEVMGLELAQVETLLAAMAAQGSQCDEQEPSGDRGADEEAVATQRAELIRRAVMQIPSERAREVIYLRWFEGLKLAEIGKRLTPKVSRERVRQIERTGREWLREKLEGVFLPGTAIPVLPPEQEAA